MVGLIILDGWGHGQDPKRSAIAQADTPFINSLYDKYPDAELLTHGYNVGLPDGQMGNSEVGHINIGAGRVVFQELARINRAIEDGSFGANPILKSALEHAANKNKNVHFMGLVSDGGVHSHINHLKALIDAAAYYGVKRSFVHAFLDGRDTDPKGGAQYLKDLLDHINNKPCELATVIGRYFAMDRDNRWERTAKAYHLLVNKKADHVTNDIIQTIAEAYDNGTTDEFMNAIIVASEDNPKGVNIQDGDLVINFNFRTDRPRQITEVLTQKDHLEHEMNKLNIDYVSMTMYDASFEGIEVLYSKDNLTNTLGEVLSINGKKQLRIAETEKYPHVTFFFSGGREEPFEGEDRIMVKSPSVATYDLAPEMSAQGITDKLLDYIETNSPDFFCLNFANADMVGHTGDFNAAIKAAEAVDGCVKQIIDKLLTNDHHFLIIADHGNSDYMINDDGTPNTAHSTNPVPVILASNKYVNSQLKDGVLADVAPTILDLMGVGAPEDMTGSSLLS